MKNAKFDQVSKDNEPFGVRQSKVVKAIIAVVNFIVLVLVLIGPLIPFVSFLHRGESQEISNTKVTIGVIGNSGLDLGLLFSSELTLASAPLNISDPK